MAKDKGKGKEAKPPSEAKDATKAKDAAKAKDATIKAKEAEAKSKEADICDLMLGTYVNILCNWLIL